MKKETGTEMPKLESPADAKGADKGKAESSSAKRRDVKKKVLSEDRSLPLLIEFGFTACVIILIIVDLITIASCILNGASLVDLVVRTSVTTFVVGGLLFLIVWQLSSGVLQTSLAKPEDKERPAEDKPEPPEFSGIENLPEL